MVLPVQRGVWDKMLQETTKLFFSLLSKPNCNSPLPCYGIMVVTSKGEREKKFVGGQLVKYRIVVLLYVAFVTNLDERTRNQNPRALRVD